MSGQLIRLIHVGCRELGLDEDARRDMQREITGKDSLKAMTEPELRLVVDRLKENGFVPAGAKKASRARPPRADLRLVHVLWRLLGEAGALERPGRDGLNAFVRSRFEATWGSVPVDIDALRDWKQIDAVIQALRAWCAREGIELDEGRLR